MSLLKSHSEYLFLLNCSRHIIRINFDNRIITVLLGFEKFKCIIIITWCNDTI